MNPTLPISMQLDSAGLRQDAARMRREMRRVALEWRQRHRYSLLEIAIGYREAAVLYLRAANLYETLCVPSP